MDVWPEVLTVVVVVAVPILGIWLYAVAFGGRSTIDSSPPKHTEAGFIASGEEEVAERQGSATEAKKNSAGD